jgi:type IV pilus assembly protein PilA
LGGSGTSSPSADHAQLIDERLASGEKNGYQFELRNWVNSEADEHKYQVVAYPKVRNQTGVRAFCSDESGVIKVDPSGSAADCLNSGAPLSTSTD